MPGAIVTGAAEMSTSTSIATPISITTSTETKQSKKCKSGERVINKVRANFSTIPKIAKA
jgi:hypothetical protein